VQVCGLFGPEASKIAINISAKSAFEVLSKYEAFHAGTVQILAYLFNGKVMIGIWRVEIMGTKLTTYKISGRVLCARKFNFPMINW